LHTRIKEEEMMMEVAIVIEDLTEVEAGAGIKIAVAEAVAVMEIIMVMYASCMEATIGLIVLIIRMEGIACLIETVVEAEASSEEEDNGEEAVVIAVIIIEIEITIAIIMVRVTRTSKERAITMKSQDKF